MESSSGNQSDGGDSDGAAPRIVGGQVARTVVTNVCGDLNGCGSGSCGPVTGGVRNLGVDTGLDSILVGDVGVAEALVQSGEADDGSVTGISPALLGSTVGHVGRIAVIGVLDDDLGVLVQIEVTQEVDLVVADVDDGAS